MAIVESYFVTPQCILSHMTLTLPMTFNVLKQRDPYDIKCFKTKGEWISFIPKETKNLFQWINSIMNVFEQCANIKHLT